MESNLKAKKFIAIACCAWASHFVSLWGGFLFDDSEAIVKNKDVMPNTPLATVFQNDFWGTNITLNSSHKSYRPLTILSYRLNIFFSNNRLDAFQFHTANVVLHGVLALMALPLYESLLKRRKYRKNLLPLDDPAFNAALLFASHPVHCEAVAALVGRADILATTLVFVLILVYKNLNNFFLWFIMVLTITGTAVLCKETAITVLGICSIYELYLKKKSSRSWTTVLTNNLFIIKFTLLILIGLLIIFLRLKIMNFEGPIFSPTDNPAAFANNIFSRFLSYNYIYLLNIVLLIWPQWLCFDWSMGCVPLIETFWDVRALFVVAFWLICFLVALRTIKTCIFKEKLQPWQMGVSIVVLAFLPASNLFVKVGFVIAERTLLLPSAGYCLLVAIGLEKLKNRYEAFKPVFLTLFVLLIVTFVTRSICRNYEWINEERLFKSGLDVCPLNAKVHYNIAKVAADQGRKEEALKSYKHAIRLHPDYEQAMNNLANLLRENGQLGEAEKLLRKAVQVRPNFAAAWMNLGIVLSSKGSLEEAELAYKTALRHRKRYSDAQYNLGNLYLDLGRHEEALLSWKEAVRLKSSHTAAWGNALALLDSEGRAIEAVELGQEALKHVPRAPSIHFAIGNALGKLHRFPEAERHFLQAITLNKGNALYYSNLGVLYHRWEKREQAKQMYLKALELDPNLNSAKTNLKKVESGSFSNAHSKNHSKKFS